MRPLTGDDAADLLLGSTGVFAAHDQTFLGGTTGRRWKLFRPFVQDNWRVTHDLTVNLGVAWALVTPIIEAHNRQANFDFDSGTFYVAGNADFGACTICVRSDSRVGIKIGQDGARAAHRRGVEAVGLAAHSDSRRICDLPRFVVEPGGAGTVGESAVLCRVG